jgi:CheY-like chemotaxis protein
MNDLRDSFILVVEDDEADIVLLRQAFQSARIINPVVNVRDGEEAIGYLSGMGTYSDRGKFPMPAMVLLDLRMPKLSGFEVLEWIRDRPSLNELIVVVLTASEDVRHANKAYELGAKSYLVKPGTFDQLVGVVKRLTGPWLRWDERPDCPKETHSSTT